MTKEELEKLYMDIYDNGILDNDYKEKFKRYVNNRLESFEKENAELKEQIALMQDTECSSCTTLGDMQIKIRELEKEKCELLGIIQGKDKAIHAEESCPDCFCEDCARDCGIKKFGLVETRK